MIRVNLLTKSKNPIDHPYKFDNFSLDDLKKDKGLFSALNSILAEKDSIYQ